MKAIEKPIKWWKNKSFCLQWYPDKPKVYNLFDMSVKLLTDYHWFGIYITLFGSFLELDLGWTRKSDHAGFRFEITIFGHMFIFYTYDQRHWDDENNDWCKYE